METNDVLLLERWRDQRDADAFAEIVHRYWRMTYVCGHRILRDSGKAEDVAQECFIGLMQARGGIRVSLGAWLHTMSVRRSLDRLKAESRRHAREKVFAENGAEPAARDVSADDVMARVDEAIEKLPKQARALVMARFFEGKTHEEIARGLGVSESAVRYRLNGVIEEVRRSLKRQGVIAGAAAVIAAMETSAAGAESIAVPARVLAKLSRLAISAPPAAIGLAGLGAGMAVKLAAVLAVVAVAGTAAWVGLHMEELPLNAGNRAGAPAAFEMALPAQAQDPRPDNARTATSAPRSQTTAAQAYSVSGRVYDAASGEGIAAIDAYLVDSATEHAVVLTAQSNSDGAFWFDGVPQGAYRVTLDRVPGYPTPFLPFAYVTVDNAAPATVDFPLVKGIFVSGVVVDTDGRPVSGAKVAAKAATEVTDIRNTKSDKEGLFALSMLPTNEVSIQARTEQWRSEMLLVSAGENGVEGLQVVLDQPRNGVISGVVITDSGARLEGANVYVHHWSPQMFPSERECVTDQAGRFRAEGCGPGDYSIIVTPKGRGFNRGEEYARVDLAAGERVELEIFYGDRGAYAISGIVVNSGGEPVAQAHVTAAMHNNPSTYTDNAGTFTLTGLDEGECIVQVYHEDYAYESTTLQAGTEDARIVLKDLCAIIGIVLRADTGEPVTEFQVSDTGAGASPLHASVYDPRSKRMFTSMDGMFRLDGIKQGKAAVIVWAKGLAPQAQYPILDYGEATELVFRLEPSRLVQGTVVDKAGAPVSGAVIYFVKHLWQTDLRGSSAAQTDDAGRFTLDSLPPEAQRLYAYKPGYGIGSAAMDDEVEIVMSAAATVVGTVEHAGLALNGIKILCSYADHDSYPGRRAVVDADNSFLLSDLSQGLLQIEVRYSVDRSVGRQVEIEEGAKVSLHFPQCGGTSSFAGRLLRGGEPFQTEMTLKQLTADGLICSATTRADADGLFLFERVMPGAGELSCLYVPDRETEPVAATFEVQVVDGADEIREFAVD